MIKIFIVLVISCIAHSCKWVCVDKNNNIKKEFINGKRISLEHRDRHEITITSEAKLMEPRKSEVTLRSPDFPVEPVKDFCKNNESHKAIKEMARKIKCRPRETIININYKGKKVIPGKVTTKLCSGFCSGYKSCISMERRNVSLAVTIPDASNKLQCSIVHIPQDTNCKCGCKKMVNVCSSKQSFDKKFCKCKCTNEAEYHVCIAKMKNSVNKYYWNKDECSCKCKNEFVCSTGSRWDHNLCKCFRQDKP